jgi:hypothetical protein
MGGRVSPLAWVVRGLAAVGFGFAAPAVPPEIWSDEWLDAWRRPTGPAPAHPERVVSDPPSTVELELWHQLFI